MQRSILVLVVLWIASIGLACCELPVDPNAPAAVPCINSAMVLEPEPLAPEYSAGPLLDPGMYDIWCGIENPDGSIDWIAYGPVELRGSMSYVFDVVNKELLESNPRNIPVYPSQASMTYKRSYDDAYGVCFGMI
jgi:hypothetical protein